MPLPVRNFSNKLEVYFNSILIAKQVPAYKWCLTSLKEMDEIRNEKEEGLA